MKKIATPICDAIVIVPEIYQDIRGYFMESWNQNDFNQAVGLDVKFVQDNHSYSFRNVLRGLHYQLLHPQDKLVRVVSGTVLDVVVDLRQSSPTFGQHYCVELSSDNRKQLWAPAGLAHGFLVLSESANLLYKTTDYYYPEDEHCIRFDDQNLGIEWGIDFPILSDKDRNASCFNEADLFP